MNKVFSVLIICTVFMLIPFNFDGFLAWKYDIQSKQKPVVSLEQIEAVLWSMETIGFEELDEDFLAHSKYNEAKYKRQAKDRDFYKIGKEDLYKYLVREFRVKDFLPQRKFYEKMENRDNEYGLIDKKLLEKLLDLCVALDKKNFDSQGFEIISGYRYPWYNEDVGGAKSSRHLHGQALDIEIKDIDRNGQIEWEDKQIVLDLLDKEIIKDKGGIGRYPHSMVVHFDTRGYRARWDSH